MNQIEVAQVDEPKDEHQQRPGGGAPEGGPVEGDEDEVDHGDGELEDDVGAGDAEVLAQRADGAQQLEEDEEGEDDDQHDQGRSLSREHFWQSIEVQSFKFNGGKWC